MCSIQFLKSYQPDKVDLNIITACVGTFAIIGIIGGIFFGIECLHLGRGASLIGMVGCIAGIGIGGGASFCAIMVRRYLSENNLPPKNIEMTNLANIVD